MLMKGFDKFLRTVLHYSYNLQQLKEKKHEFKGSALTV